MIDLVVDGARFDREGADLFSEFSTLQIPPGVFPEVLFVDYKGKLRPFKQYTHDRGAYYYEPMNYELCTPFGRSLTIFND